MINVVFFAQLREQLQCESCGVNLNQVSVDEVRRNLIEDNTQWRSFLEKNDLLVAINQSMASFSDIVKDGDEVALFPPVTGG